MEESIQISGAAPAELPPAGPPMSAIQTLVGVFTKPKAVFQALSDRPRVLAPILILVAVQAVLGIVLVQSGVLANDAIARLEAQGKPQEAIDAVQQVFESPARFALGVVGPVLGVGFSLLAGGFLLYFMANLMLGARLRFRHYVSIAAYGGVVAIVDQGVRTALGVTRGTLSVRLGVGAFLADSPGLLLRVLDSATDPLLLWAFAVEALGVGVMARKTFGFGVLAVLPGFLILLLASSLQA
ncbi:MAG: YIP1 family protein [Candidatus Latescibacteria bacterium]|nr:YIP1 family protein [Candidatus Latescibacterota bacterium]